MPVLTFKGKTAVENYHHVVPHHVLEVDRKLSALGKGENPSLDGNLIVEGDNLLALKALLPTHAGKVKCIYIDPPYNTGNEGWIYNDNLTQPQFKEWIGKVVGKEGEDACRHDKWCCMMYPRLRLLRELLRDDGAIFVSIDSTEAHRLKCLLDEIFGEENFIECVTWLKKISPSNDAKWFSSDCDYLLVYARAKDVWRPRRLKRTAEQAAYYRNPDNDPRGPWNSVAYTCNKTARERPNLHYPIRNPNTGKSVWPKKTAVWKWVRDVTADNVKKNLLYWGKDGKATSPRLKFFLSEAGDIVPRSLWSYEDVGSTQEATSEVRELLPETGFSSPKPVRLVERILELATDSHSADFVLDSFAGSGTTAHAVLARNAGDGGNRRFVLVQAEHDSREGRDDTLNICRRITRERVVRVIQGYRPATGKRVDGIGGRFSYARVGAPLLGGHRNWGERMPSYEDLARYVFFTETGKELDPKKADRRTSKMGEHGGASYYLLYTPDPKASVPLDQMVLDTLASDQNPLKVVYCEKIWVHREDLAKMRKEIGEVRLMLLPFQVRAS